jgi:hypothetical protein
MKRRKLVGFKDFAVGYVYVINLKSHLGRPTRRSLATKVKD